MKREQLTDITLREIAWLGAFVFWAYYKKPDNGSFLEIRLDPIGIIGLGLIIIGIVVHVWSAWVLAAAIHNPNVTNGGVAKGGPYLYVRNPIYLTGGMVFVGIFLIYAKFRISDLVAGVVVAILLHLYVVRVEEPATERRLGTTYDNYRSQVPRWVPKPPFRFMGRHKSG